MNSLQQCDLQRGDTVLVLGAGPMGLMNACVARSFGAGKIILSELNEARLAQAESFGCDVLVNPAKEDLAARVMAETGGLGADVAIVAAPAAAPQEQAVHLVRKRGTVVLFASLPKGASNLTIDSRPIHYGELRVVGTSDSAPWHVEKAVAAAGRRNRARGETGHPRPAAGPVPPSIGSDGERPSPARCAAAVTRIWAQTYRIQFSRGKLFHVAGRWRPRKFREFGTCYRLQPGCYWTPLIRKHGLRRVTAPRLFSPGLISISRRPRFHSAFLPPWVNSLT